MHELINACNESKTIQERLFEAEQRILELEEENEILEKALADSIKFYSVDAYNKRFKMGWDIPLYDGFDSMMASFCRSRAIRIRHCKIEGVPNSYPLTAWEALLGIL